MCEYDSRAETLGHILKVCENMNSVVSRLLYRAEIHDQSKLGSPEKEAFDQVTPQLRGLTYGSDSYRACLRQIKPALDHHYKYNPHHPEHFGELGISGMSLIDLIEMLCDWKAATLRHADGDINKSLAHNRGRFGMGDQLEQILRNTIEQMGWK